jgi:predicted transcriptional regulator
MPNTVKTAITVPRALVSAADTAAERLGMSRSGLFVKALEDYLRREEAARLVEAINASLGGDESNSAGLTKARRRAHYKLVRGEW